jgi:hypothetical protein
VIALFGDPAAIEDEQPVERAHGGQP